MDFNEEICIYTFSFQIQICCWIFLHIFDRKGAACSPDKNKLQILSKALYIYKFTKVFIYTWHSFRHS